MSPNPASPVKSVISANRLGDGTVVFVGRSGDWVETIRQARLFSHAAEADQCLALAKADEASNLIVEPYVFSVRFEGGNVVPVALRDAIRAAGPTIAYRAAEPAEG